MNIREIKNGVIFSYLLIVTNTLYGIVFTPFLVSIIGSGEYGVYKIVGSLIGSITILDLGIGSSILRFSAKFYAENDKEKLSNFAAMGLIQATILSVIMISVCVVVYFQFDGIYGETLTAEELAVGKELFLFFIVILVLNMYEKVMFNVISGCEHYSFANGMKLLHIIMKLFLSYKLVSRTEKTVTLLQIEIILLIITLLLQSVYLKNRVGIRIRFHYWDNTLFKQSFSYMLLMFIQSLASQFNGNLDNMVIGAYLGSTAVAVYSIGLQFYNMYEQFALSFSNFMLPSVSKQILSGASNRELEETVIKVGRFEFMALGGALCGYIVIGREFINLWLGPDYIFAWIVGLLLMIPTTIPLVQNVCLSILRAKNKIGFRTAAVCIMSVFNFCVTVIGVQRWGAIAACVGTVIGLVVANIVVMNIYYVKVIKLNIFRIFKDIADKTWICCLAASLILILADKFLYGTWILWFIKVLIFVIVYGGLLMLHGFRDYERRMVKQIFHLKS